LEGSGEMNPYRESYHKKLDQLNVNTEELASLVNDAVVHSVEALRTYDVELAKDVLNRDQIADDLGQKIESNCMELLALQQPMAKDQRMIIGILKIGIDLKGWRPGSRYTRVTIQSKDKPHITKLEYIPRMAEIGSKMLTEAAEALNNSDSDMARQVTKWDYDIDSLYDKCRDKLMKIVVANPELIDDATPFSW
jgi:phosphate transport system protein